MSEEGHDATPDDERERLALAERAYDAGDFAKVRALSLPLLSSSDAELAAGAARLRAKIAVDPLALVVLAMSLVLCGVLVHAYVL